MRNSLKIPLLATAITWMMAWSVTAQEEKTRYLIHWITCEIPKWICDMDTTNLVLQAEEVATSMFTSKDAVNATVGCRALGSNEVHITQTDSFDVFIRWESLTDRPYLVGKVVENDSRGKMQCHKSHILDPNQNDE